MQKRIFIRISDFLSRQEIPIQHLFDKVLLQETFFSFVINLVYDILGREIATLVNEEKPAGSYEVEFYGSELSSGVYFYKLQTGSFVETRKMILMK